MTSICFYFHAHQPRRIKRYKVFDIGKDKHYFNDTSETDLNNSRILRKVADKCYLPTNKMLLDLLNRHPEFKVSFSLSGIFLEQLEEEIPEVLDSFRKLVETGRVELINETYYHSLAYLYSVDEFVEQVNLHAKKLMDLFGVKPTVFRNTELIYNNALAKTAEEMGFKAILTEGADHILGWRSPNFVYRPVGTEKIRLLLKNYKLSDDVAFRFSSKAWVEHPLTAPKFADWISKFNGSGEIVNLFMDYETFGEHQWEDTGIFNFLDALPAEVLKHPDNDFVTPSEAADRYEAKGEVDIHNFISWADMERDLSAWLSNSMQHDSCSKLYALEPSVKKLKNEELIETWRRLQTSDHFYYMCTKWWSDGDVHKYFSPYESPYDAFISFMNVLNDFQLRVEGELKKYDDPSNQTEAVTIIEIHPKIKKMLEEHYG
jgi:alpha-amylase